jgi:hypothetical protein
MNMSKPNARARRSEATTSGSLASPFTTKSTVAPSCNVAPSSPRVSTPPVRSNTGRGKLRNTVDTAVRSSEARTVAFPGGAIAGHATEATLQ